ncbi:hypothetical protein [Roseomonas marmotae]|uniref:RcnB family protein n=1 Tax=Roseomonas marmotae TaxID=2768161 RepID=A0ABS3KFW4_9PROT|nr:hypothetical protein [Roseomonas marmotae]MBO1076366.1 hypothetical protein [Roseomonas marmotae]QTI79424.1 hypothetical protein IAI58_00910 [Roseomonas marmotae]
MARISSTLAAASLAVTMGGGIAHAQTGYPTAGAPSASGYQVQQPMGSQGFQASPELQTSTGRPVVPVPPNPFSDLNLPNQQVGNGAYMGGGAVIEYLPDGTRRVVPMR